MTDEQVTELMERYYKDEEPGVWEQVNFKLLKFIARESYKRGALDHGGMKL